MNNTSKTKNSFPEKGNPNLSKKRALLLLWSGSAIIIFFMFFKWYSTDQQLTGRREINGAKDLLIDELLLIPGELKLETSSPLVNINSMINQKDGSYSKAIETEKRKEVFKKILEEKIKKATIDNSKDFSIKPIPNE